MERSNTSYLTGREGVLIVFKALYFSAKTEIHDTTVPQEGFKKSPHKMKIHRQKQTCYNSTSRRTQDVIQTRSRQDQDPLTRSTEGVRKSE